MSKQAPVEPLMAIVPAPDAGPDIFANNIPPWTPREGTRGIFGGFLIAQAMLAAQATAPPAFDVHSLQSVFVRPGSDRPRILYVVERVSDGRSFATRVVRATQAGECLYVATVGLQRGRGGGGDGGVGGSSSSLEHAVPMPDMGGLTPADIPGTSENSLLSAIGFGDDSAWGVGVDNNGPADPFEWRHLPSSLDVSHSSPDDDDSSSGSSKADQSQTKTTRAIMASPRRPPPTEYRLHSFVRSPPISPEQRGDSAVHVAALGFLSDAWLISTLNLACPAQLGWQNRNVAVQATINHSVLIHDAARARADEWMVCERKTTWAGGEGRVLIEQRFWDWATGRLVLSCWQEGLVRLKTRAAANL